MTSLLLVSLGPVQDFIAAARRGRDLWFGSWFLSEISKAAALTIQTEEGEDALIFPAPADPQWLKPSSDFNCVNKLLARITGDPDQLMAKVQKATEERLMEIWGTAKKQMKGGADQIQTENAIAQLKDLLELTWVALPLPDERNYSEVRNQLESLLHARKSLREFNVVTWGAPVPKSALDGVRESVIHEEAYKPRAGEARDRREWRLYTHFGVSLGERLCAIGLLKRLGRPEDWRKDTDEEHRAPSASHIAAIPLLTRIKQDPEAWDRVGSYVKHLGELGEAAGRPPRELRGDLYFPPGDTKNPFPCQGRILYDSRLPELLGSNDAAAQASKALKKLLRKLADGLEPSPYYALILADGDRMGEAVDRQNTIIDHKKLSKALSEFAKNVRDIIDGDLNGRLIYAGGDDILAFLPLHTLRTGIEALAELFQRAMKRFGDEKTSPTLSFGVVIAHHMDPLSGVLERVREAEKIAKATPGKDALAITLSKRGGADVTVCDTTARLLERLEQFTDWHSGDLFPDGAAYELRDAALRHDEPKKGDPNAGQKGGHTDRIAKKALAYDALRILSRKQAKRGSQKVDENVRKSLESRLLDESLPIRTLADELIVARVFADAAHQAGETPHASTQRSFSQTEAPV